MADNYVQIKIKASDDAKPDLTALKFDLDELGAKVETARVEVDDKEASATLLSLNARLADLNRKVANPRLNTAGAARVEAQIASVDAALDKLNDKHVKPEVTLKGAAEVLAEVELLDHELDKMDRKAAAAGPTGLLGRILTGAEGAGGGGGGVGGLAGMLPSGPALAGLAAAVPLVGALAVELTGLASGFAAAGAGAGAFGLLAMPAFKSVTGALTQVKADQNAYDRALTKTAKNNALKHLQEDYAKLDPAQRAAVKGVQSLSAEFGKLSKAFEPQAMKIFNDGLKIANDLMPALSPMANAFANALDPLLKQFDKFTKSKGFQDWLKKFTSDIGPAVTAIGKGLGKVGPALGKFLTLLSRKDVAHAITIAFTVLADIITILTAGIKRFMQNWDQMSSAFRRTRHDIASAGHDIAHVFDTIRHAVASFAHEVAHDFDDVRHFNATLAHDFAHAFDTIRHAVATLGHDIATWFDRIRHSIASKFDAAVSYIKGIPHRILSALGNLGSLLFNAGKAIIQGLINGIKSMLGPVGNAMGWVMNEVKSFLPFSPAKKGPLSGAGAPSNSGRSIALQLAQGMESGLGPVRSAASRMAGSAGIAGGAGGASGGGGHAVIQIAPKGGSGLEQQFWTWLKNGVRAQGGDPAMFQKKVAFR